MWRVNLKKIPKICCLEDNRITKEFNKAFWDDLKTLFLSLNKAFKVRELSTSQKQAAIKWIEKKDKDQQLIKNWRPISFFKVDTKLSWASKNCTSFPNIFKLKIFKQQNIFICERRHLMTLSDLLKLKGLLLTVDTEKPLIL